MNGPTVRQLLNLADRAERGRLTPAEAATLRAGIQAMADQRGITPKGGDPVNEQTTPTHNWIP